MLETLRPVLETALDAVVVMRRDGTVAAWNGAAQATFGWTEAEALGRPMRELIIPPQHREAHDRGLQRFNATGEARVLNQRIEISAIDREGREFPIELSITTSSADDELFFVGFLRDITARRESEQRLARQAREAQLLFDVTSLAADTSSFEDALRSCLTAICNVAGWPVGHALVRKEGGSSELVSTSVWYEQSEGIADALRGVTGNCAFPEGVGLPGMVLASGEPVWIADTQTEANFPRKGLGFGSAFGFPIKSEGKVVAVLEFFAQGNARPDADLMLTVRTLGEQVGRVLERKRTEEHQQLLIHELNHRVKNTLAIVQSVANQTFKGAAAETSAKEAFESRLQALASAHDVLSRENWESASIGEVVSRVGLGCGASPDRVHASGPDVRLAPRKAVSLAMALHELCTNAVKYGALSNEVGSVDITWKVANGSGGTRLRLEWREQGGPTVELPQSAGFGTRMIQRALAAELEGSVDLLFEPGGLHCLVEAPIN
jgi:PAS domain S-box-containing protein